MTLNTALAADRLYMRAQLGLVSRLVPSIPRSFVIAGDSIARDGASGPGTAPQLFSSGPYEMGIWKAGGRIIQNASVPGDTSTLLLARFDTDVLAYPSDGVLIGIGTNDNPVTAISNGQIATLFNNLEQMVIRTRDRGRLPIIVVPPTKGTNGSAQSANARKLVPFYYRLAEIHNLPLIDLFRITADPTTGAWAYATTGGDDTHPDLLGKAACGNEIFRVLSDIGKHYAPPYVATVQESSAGVSLANLLPRGNFAADTTGYTLDSTNVTVTTPAAAFPYTGKTLTLVKSDETDEAAITGATATTGFASGDWLRFSARMKVSNLPAATSVNTRDGFDLGITMAGFLRRLVTAFEQEGEYFPATDLQVMPATTSIGFGMTYRDSGTYELNNLTLVNLTAMDAIYTFGLI